MSYSDWLNSIASIIPQILSWINSIVNSLLGNYIIITILGFVLFYSLISLTLYIIYSLRDHNTDFDNIK